MTRAGDKVTVKIGDETKETTIGTDGKWKVEFDENNLPPDGTYETEVTFIHNLALPDEIVRKIPLYELDRQPEIDHLTTIFVPAVPENRGIS